jgi:3-isopropylmalate dehydrogenase
MMLEHLGEEEAGRAVEEAVIEVLGSGKLGDLSAKSGVSTSETGDLIAERV